MGPERAVGRCPGRSAIGRWTYLQGASQPILRAVAGHDERPSLGRSSDYAGSPSANDGDHMRPFIPRPCALVMVGVAAAVSGQAAGQSAPAPQAGVAERTEAEDQITV